MFALIFTRKLPADHHRLELGWRMFAGRIARPRAISLRTNSGRPLARGGEGHLLGHDPAPRVVHLRAVAVVARIREALGDPRPAHRGRPCARLPRRARGVVQIEVLAVRQVHTAHGDLERGCAPCWNAEEGLVGARRGARESEGWVRHRFPTPA
jgi:hypothetical protein